MPTQPVGNEGFITDLDIRIFLRDTDPAANVLIKDLEYAPEEIRTAMTLAVDLWNETPPSVAVYNINNFPFRRHFLLETTANLLMISAARFRRNSLTLSITGGSVNDQDKAGPYEAASLRLHQEFMGWMMSKKVEMNTAMGWGWI